MPIAKMSVAVAVHTILLLVVYTSGVWSDTLVKIVSKRLFGLRMPIEHTLWEDHVEFEESSLP